MTNDACVLEQLLENKQEQMTGSPLIHGTFGYSGPTFKPPLKGPRKSQSGVGECSCLGYLILRRWCVYSQLSILPASQIISDGNL